MAKEFAPWNQTVLYQVYPWSFKEDEGHKPQRGNGSIGGIIEELPYLIDLGVDAIWVSPPYPGPMKDAGYDISDFTDIHPELGTLEDFDKLAEKCHENGIRVMLDFIPNHTSDQHEWFQKSRRREPGYEDFYIWHPGKLDENGIRVPPNNWASKFSKQNRLARDRGEMPWLKPSDWTPPISAWTWDELRGEYYLHKFIVEQPDLNWQNNHVAQAMLDSMRFWCDRGVDGFRMDAFNHAAKNYDFIDEPINEAYDEQQYANPYYQLKIENSGNYMPEYKRILKLFAGLAREYQEKGRDIQFVIESYMDKERLWQANDVDPEVATTFNFEAFRMPWDARLRKEQADRYYATIDPRSTPNQLNGNHDNPRLASRLGDGAARAAAMMNLFLPGMRVIYNGEELGLHDGDVPQDRLQDPSDLRDGARMPIIWDDAKPNAGFSKATSEDLWLPINEADLELSVARQECDPKSSLALYRAATHLCRELPVLREGRYIPADTSNPNIFAFARSTGGDHAFILTNFSDEMQPVRIHESLSLAYKVLLTSIDVHEEPRPDVHLHDSSLQLRPNESIVIVPNS